MKASKSSAACANEFPASCLVSCLVSHARRTFLGIVPMLGLLFGSCGVTWAQPAQLPTAPVTLTGWADDWTVLTMAQDGAWGVATEETVGLAIARAIANCKKTSRAELGCGAAFKAIQAGWSLGLRCGEQNIIAAETTLSGAEQAAINREMTLRRSYVPDMPPCKRVVTVDPRGVIVDRTLGVSGQVDLHRR